MCRTYETDPRAHSGETLRFDGRLFSLLLVRSHNGIWPSRGFLDNKLISSAIKLPIICLINQLIYRCTKNAQIMSKRQSPLCWAKCDVIRRLVLFDQIPLNPKKRNINFAIRWKKKKQILWVEMQESENIWLSFQNLLLINY